MQLWKPQMLHQCVSEDRQFEEKNKNKKPFYVESNEQNKLGTK